jgi:hypothetical protein
MSNGAGSAAQRCVDEGDAVSRHPPDPAVAPDTLIRSRSGRISAWSPGMQHRYGFSSAEATGHISHQLLRTIFPYPLQTIESTLTRHTAWTGSLIHRHADGRAVMAVNHWYVHRANDDDADLVTEVHSNVASDGICMRHQLADVLIALASELSEPLTAIHNYVDGAQRLLGLGWPDLVSVREAMTLASGQITRGAQGVRLLHDLAASMRDKA